MLVRTSPTMLKRSLRRNRLQRLFGVPATRPPRDPGCWIYSLGRVQIDLTRTPELRRREGAIRLEGGDLPMKLLVMRGDDGRFHAFYNRCGHAGRCLDPLGGTCMVQCCSLGKSTYNYRGEIVSGPAARPATTCPVRVWGSRLVVLVSRAQNSAFGH